MKKDIIKLRLLKFYDYNTKIHLEYSIGVKVYDIKLSRCQDWIDTWGAIIRVMNEVMMHDKYRFLSVEEMLHIYHVGMEGVVESFVHSVGTMDDITWDY
jgi:hypothetical protein